MDSSAVRFSKRTAWDTGESALTCAIREARAAGHTLVDLTVSNPTACGFTYDSGAILAALNNPDAMTYNPDPHGLPKAREAVARYYASHGAQVDASRIQLTTSTSEAYSFLFRLLCDPGDEVLVAQPSYPLFDFLADLDDVQLQPYPLFYDYGWWIDFAELERRITPRTRAILLVHPNNPTGHATSRTERERLEAICVKHGLALIVDEVFLDYNLNPDTPIDSFATGPHPALTFVLSGLSKIAALPQMKVAWLACFGPSAQVAPALDRLEVIADTFLSMNAPAQHALPAWLASREAIVPQIRARVQQNFKNIEDSTLEVMPLEAGWSAVIRLPMSIDGHIEDLVREAGVFVYPGTFYALPGTNRVVVSLIGPTQDFREGIQKLQQWCESKQLT